MIEFGRVATPELLEVVSIIEELRNTSSTNEKKAILTKYEDKNDLKKLLELTYNPHKKYKMTEKSIDINDFDENGVDGYVCFGALLKKLSESNINDKLRQDTNKFLAFTDERIRDLYKCVLLKDLKIGVNATTLNKVWKGLIPAGETGVEIKPMLASKFNFDKPPVGDFAVTEKLDGIRCLAICKEDSIQLFSRQGKLIEGCVSIETTLMGMRMQVGRDFVLDGELLAMNCGYDTVYKETTKRVKNKNEIKEGIYYMAFDMLEMEEFNQLKGIHKYHERLQKLLDLDKLMGSMFVRIIRPLYIGNDMDEVLELLKVYKKLGAEGIMVNLMDAPYEFKRSKNILKVKVMQTADLRIVGFEEGQGRNAGKLGAILVDFKGNKVGVGSGFTDFDREYIWKNQDQYLGKIAEIQYFEITKDKTGTESLRFPVWKYLRTDKTEPSLY